MRRVCKWHGLPNVDRGVDARSSRWRYQSPRPVNIPHVLHIFIADWHWSRTFRWLFIPCVCAHARRPFMPTNRADHVSENRKYLFLIVYKYLRFFRSGCVCETINKWKINNGFRSKCAIIRVSIPRIAGKPDRINCDCCESLCFVVKFKCFFNRAHCVHAIPLSPYTMPTTNSIGFDAHFLIVNTIFCSRSVPLFFVALTN